jgi:hypothetical protein
MEIRLLSTLAKVMSDKIYGGFSSGELTMLSNLPDAFIASVNPDSDGKISLSIESSLKTEIFFEKKVFVGRTKPDDADDYYVGGGKSGYYPDALIKTCECDGKKGEWSSFRIEIIPDGRTGDFPVKVTVKNGILKASVNETVHILPGKYPEQSLICTHWFHTDCLALTYKTEVFSEKYWTLVSNYMKTAASNGINSVLTPLFTPPLDTEKGGERLTVQLVSVTVNSKGKYKFGFDNLKKWIDTADSAGIKYFEFSHLYTQWGAKHAPKIIAKTKDGEKRIFGWETKSTSKKYRDFLEQFARALKIKLRQWKTEDRVIFHVSDEPNGAQIRKYKKAADEIKKLFGEYKIIDACSEIKYYEKGVIKNPVPSIASIEDFYGKVPELWTYYCCGPGNDYLPNRFIAMPNLRIRIIGMIMFRYDVKGFLHWGYNYWFTQLSKELVNPYEQTDSGGKFPGGDGFVVYPGDNCEPTESVRLKFFADAVRDYELLREIERKKSREEALKYLTYDGQLISNKNYPRSEEWFIKTRNKMMEDLSNEIH